MTFFSPRDQTFHFTKRTYKKQISINWWPPKGHIDSINLPSGKICLIVYGFSPVPASKEQILFQHS